MSLACGIAILLADQWSKRAIQIYGGDRTLGWAPVVQFRFAMHREKFYERTGARIALVLGWLVALGCAMILRHSGVWFQGTAPLAGLGVAFGGAASNLADILGRRYVIDFIDLGWWPVFNLADVAIVAGLAAAFLG